MVRLNGICQIAINVRDVPRAVAFYRDVLGMTFLFELPTMGFFDCGGIRLMLSKAESPEFDHRASLIYYKVDDIQQTFEMLAQQSVEFVAPPRLIAQMSDHDLWMAFFYDPDHNALALMSEVPHVSEVTSLSEATP
jgi:predicted enzyme related to lactoylglutathione lyase